MTLHTQKIFDGYGVVMTKKIALTGLKNCFTIDGKFSFNCSNCRKKWYLNAPKNKRKLNIRCKCGHAYVVKLNRRKDRRSPVRDCTAHRLLSERSSSPVKIVNSSFGGYCVEVKAHVAKNLLVGDCVTLEYFMLNSLFVDDFLVCSIRGNRVGLQYADKKSLSPSQRMIIRKT